MDKEEAKRSVSVKLAYGSASDTTQDVLVHIESTTEAKRPPTDICVVVDTSYSMCNECQNGDQESQGLSILDIVKHATKTVIATLGQNDRFALVSFSTCSLVRMPLTAMDEAGKDKANTAVNDLDVESQTNIWGGLEKGLDVLDEAGFDPKRASAVLLLTDGQPNVEPPSGHIPTFIKYKDAHDSARRCSVSTFGFGYNLDSELLKEIAAEGQGTYAFIPDGGFVGTAFVNATSNILATAARQLTLKISSDFPVECAGNSHLATATSWGLQLPLGSLQFGQARDVVVRVTLPAGEHKDEKSPAILRADIDFGPIGGGVELETAWGEVPIIGDADPDKEALVQAHRTRFVEVVTNAQEIYTKGDHAKAKEMVSQLLDEYKTSIVATDPRVVDLCKDAEGQVTEALSKDRFFKKWGKHYLPSLVGAHRLQQCNNFKDPGVQHYGGALFAALRDVAEANFLKVPPPTPSIRKRPANHSHGLNHAPARPVNMNAYYNCGGGCFTGDSLILCPNGTTKRVDKLKAGDQVSLHANAKTTKSLKTATVRWVVETISDEAGTRLVTLPNGPRITPWHPVLWNGEWTFPAHIDVNGSGTLEHAPASQVPSVFNLVLDGAAGHSPIISGVPVVTLGHGIKDDAVASHSYYGTQRVLDDLAKLPSHDGRIVVHATALRERPDENNNQPGQVVGLNLASVHVHAPSISVGV